MKLQDTYLLRGDLRRVLNSDGHSRWSRLAYAIVRRAEIRALHMSVHAL